MKLPFDISKIEKKYLFAIPIVLIIFISAYLNSRPIVQQPQQSEYDSQTDDSVIATPAVTPLPYEIIDPATNNGKNTTNKITIGIWKEEIPDIIDAIDYYKKRNPGNEVVFKEIPYGTYMDKLSSEIQSKADIDIFLVKNVNDYAVAMERKLCADIDQKVRSSELDTNQYGSAFKDLKSGNKLFGLPYKRNVYMLYYNRNILAEKRLSIPLKAMTWNEYRELAKKLTNKNANPKIYGAFIDLQPQSWYIQAIQNGTNLKETEYKFFESAIQYRFNLERDGSIPSFKDEEYWKLQYNTEFPNGTIGMHITGDWHMKQLLTNSKVNFDWDVAPVPRPVEVQTENSIGNYSLMCINLSSNKLDKAFELMRFVCGPEGAKKIARLSNLPGYIDTETINIYEEQFGGKPQNARIAAKTNFSLEYPVDPKSLILANEIFYEESSNVFLGKTSLNTFKKNVENRKAELERR